MKLPQTLETHLYSYDPADFMPIYEDGQLANRAAFIGYKLGWANQRLIEGVRHVASTMIEAVDTVTAP